MYSLFQNKSHHVSLEFYSAFLEFFASKDKSKIHKLSLDKLFKIAADHFSSKHKNIIYQQLRETAEKMIETIIPFIPPNELKTLLKSEEKEVKDYVNNYFLQKQLRNERNSLNV